MQYDSRTTSLTLALSPRRRGERETVRLAKSGSYPAWIFHTLRETPTDRSRRREEADASPIATFPPPHVGGYGTCERCGLESFACLSVARWDGEPRLPNATRPGSADFQSAVSRVSNPPEPCCADGLPRKLSGRNGRLETCATPHRSMGSFHVPKNTHRGHDLVKQTILSASADRWRGRQDCLPHVRRFMGSLHGFTVPHWAHEPMQSNDQVLMHMHQKFAHAERPTSPGSWVACASLPPRIATMNLSPRNMAELANSAMFLERGSWVASTALRFPIGAMNRSRRREEADGVEVASSASLPRRLRVVGSRKVSTMPAKPYPPPRDSGKRARVRGRGCRRNERSK